MTACLFKNAIKPEVGSAAWVTLCSAPADKASLVLQINGSILNDVALNGSARIYDSSADRYSYLVREAPIPQGDAIRLIDQAKIVLEANDRIEVLCNTPDKQIDFIGSFIEDINDSTSGFALGEYKNAVLSVVGNDWTDLYVAPSDMTTFVLQINAANTSNSGVQISVRIYDSSEALWATVLDSAQIPVADAIRLIDHSKIVLEPGDRIQVKCTTAGAVDVVASLIEDVNRG